jgi:cell division protein FtsB
MELGQIAPKVQGVARALLPWGRRLYHWRWRLTTTAVVLLATWMGFHVYSGPNGWIAFQQKKLEHQNLQQQVEQLRQENETLDRRVKALKSDRSAIEKEAREQLHYVRPGEIIYVMPEAKPASPPRNTK